MPLRTTCLAVTASLAATTAHAQLVVGNNQTVSTIYHVDVDTGAATALYTGGAEAKCSGLAYNRVTNTLYWNYWSQLYSSPFSLAGLTPTLLGTMTFEGSAEVFSGLAFYKGKLLGTQIVTGSVGIYEIDLETLEATLFAWSTSAVSFSGIDVDATSSLAYGVSNPFAGRGFYEIDLRAQTATFLSPYPQGEADFSGVAAHNGLAFLVTRYPQWPIRVYEVETGTQVGTLPSPFTAYGSFTAGATYVPERPVSLKPESWGAVKGRYR